LKYLILGSFSSAFLLFGMAMLYGASGGTLFLNDLNQRLGADPARCLVFEDSAHGVAAAKAAGMRCVALRRANASGQDLSLADRVVDDLRECLVEME